MKGIFLTLGILAVMVACKPSHKRVRFDDGYAEGVIRLGIDTVYEGEIKFYDVSGDKLTRVANYKNSLLHGLLVNYEDNHRYSSFTYFYGLRHGEALNYNAKDQVTGRGYYHYDVFCGPVTHFDNGKVVDYFFTSFDGFDLLYIDYDSIQNKKVSEWNGNRIYVKQSHQTTDAGTHEVFDVYFLNLVSPPLYTFRYNLFKSSKDGKQTIPVQDFDNDKVFDQFEISQLDTAFYHGIKLEIYKGKELLSTEIKILDKAEQ